MQTGVVMAMTPLRRGLLPAAAVVLVVSVIATAGNHRWHDTNLTRSSPGFMPFVSLPPQATATARTAPPIRPIQIPHWIPVVLSAFLVALALVLLLLIVRALWPLVRRLLGMLRRKPRPAPVAPGGSVDLGLGGFSDSLRAGVREAEEDLSATSRTSSDAVIACWLRLEDAAAGSGTLREAWQTPSEFTSQLLVSQHADPAACARLLLLYQRARFGHEHLNPDDTAAAVDALRRIAATLGGTAGVATVTSPAGVGTGAARESSVPR